VARLAASLLQMNAGAGQAHNLGQTLQRRYAAALGLWIPPAEAGDSSDVALQEPQMLLTPKAGATNAGAWSESAGSGNGSASSSDLSPSSGSQGIPQILARSTNFPRTYQSGTAQVHQPIEKDAPVAFPFILASCFSLWCGVQSHALHGLYSHIVTSQTHHHCTVLYTLPLVLSSRAQPFSC